MRFHIIFASHDRSNFLLGLLWRIWMFRSICPLVRINIEWTQEHLKVLIHGDGQCNVISQRSLNFWLLRPTLISLQILSSWRLKLKCHTKITDMKWTNAEVPMQMSRYHAGLAQSSKCSFRCHSWECAIYWIQGQSGVYSRNNGPSKPTTQAGPPIHALSRSSPTWPHQAR